MIDHKVRGIVNSLSRAKDDRFVENLLLGLLNAIDAQYVFVAEINDERTLARTCNVIAYGESVDNFEYALSGTPCENTQSGTCCVHPSGIQPLYPEDLLLVDMGIEGYVGVPLKNSRDETDFILVALFTEPVENAFEVESLFLLFSGMLLKELEKQSVIEKLKMSDQIIRESKEAIIITDSATKIVYVNKAFSNITGYSLAEVEGKRPNVLSSGQHDKQFYQSLWHDLNETGYWQGEIVNKSKDGHLFPTRTAIQAFDNGNKDGLQYVGFFTDITEEQAKDSELYLQTHFDSLTGLANRFFLAERIREEIDVTGDSETAFFVLYIGLDHFKDINDFYGFATGDELLVRVAGMLKTIVQDSDLLARVGGDQFGLFFKADRHDAVHRFLDRAYSLFEPAISLAGHHVQLDISVGVAKYPDDGSSMEDLLSKAEQALYQAKESGRNRISFYTDDIQAKVIARVSLKNALKVAIEKEQVNVVFQPIIDLETSKVIKLEALARWEYEGSPVSPDDFIRIAEEFGLIYDLGCIILRKSCEAVVQLKTLGWLDLSVNVNRSIKEFERKECVQEWLSIVGSHNLEGRDVNFELTESILAPEQKNNLEKLARLQEAGSIISLDDFGTGFSSLSYLRNFPIDELKIDRSFVAQMDRDEEDRVLVNTIIAMAKALGMRVVAEGIETEEQKQQLLAMGCDSGQGYFISKPLELNTLITYLDFIE